MHRRLLHALSLTRASSHGCSSSLRRFAPPTSPKIARSKTQTAIGQGHSAGAGDSGGDWCTGEREGDGGCCGGGGGDGGGFEVGIGGLGFIHHTLRPCEFKGPKTRPFTGRANRCDYIVTIFEGHARLMVDARRLAHSHAFALGDSFLVVSHRDAATSPTRKPLV